MRCHNCLSHDYVLYCKGDGKLLCYECNYENEIVMPNIWIKQGVLGDLQPIARKGLGKVAKLYKTSGLDLFVTSLRDGNHSDGSLHYDGLAFDIRKGIEIYRIKLALGGGWDVVEEVDHIHCEYDPK